MSIEYISASPIHRWLKPTYRTIPEQILGFLIFLSVSFSLFFLTQWIISSGQASPWYQQLIQAPWAIQTWGTSLIWGGYHILMPLSIWMVWRRFSFFTLKLELSIFLAQCVFQTLWTLSFFFFHEPLLSLFALMFLLCNTLLCILLFRKKERTSYKLLLLPFLWIFYIVGVNMAICVVNP